MGDSSNIKIIDQFKPEQYIHLYSHWGGEDIIKSAVHGLRSGRATDSPYLARVIFNHMTKDDVDGETGYGIAVEASDNEHPIFVINVHDETVYFEGADETPVTYARFLAVYDRIGFAESFTEAEYAAGDTSNYARYIKALNA